MERPALVYDSSSFSNPDVSSYAPNSETSPMPNAAKMPLEGKKDRTQRINKREDAGAEQPDRNSRALSHRERNRIAAHKCRQKNKQNVQSLQQQERVLAEQNKFLSAHVDHLKNEVLGLRNEILNHGSCDCELIQNYIAETARNLHS